MIELDAIVPACGIAPLGCSFESSFFVSLEDIVVNAFLGTGEI